MPHHQPANRDNEFNLFKQMAAGACEECILLLQAPGEMGKSTLLSAFEQWCRAESTPCALVDLKGDSVGLDEVFSRLCDDLGWAHFSRFRQQVVALARPISVNIDHNVMIGQNEIKAVLQAPDEATRRSNQTQLTQALFDDLRHRAGRLVFIFDTYEKANPDVQDWLSGPCLARARRTSNLAVVVAGRTTPPQSSEWQSYCHHHTLPPIDNVEAWETYIRNRGLAVPREWVRAFCVSTGGHPAQIDTLLAGAVQHGGQA